VVLGHSELSLQSYFQLEGKAQVKVVCMDLATHYRSLVGKHFPNAKIVAESLPCHPLGQSTLRDLLARAGPSGV
jgi:transposase